VKVDRRVLGVFRGSDLVESFAVGLRLKCRELCRDSHLVNGAGRLAVMSIEIESFRQRCDVVSVDLK